MSYIQLLRKGMLFLIVGQMEDYHFFSVDYFSLIHYLSENKRVNLYL